jgi:hypothetical protein
LVSFQAFTNAVENAHAEIDKSREELDDVPEEFLDPLMQTLMTDPVLLPSSKQIVDRSVIARHLLSDPTDPFTRKPLSINDVQADMNLKKNIQEWLQQHKKK